MNVCESVFVSVLQVWCQQSRSCHLFADVVSELSEYWQTPGLSGMDTIYGPAQVTASDLVKKWRISLQEGIKSRGTKMSVLINLHGSSKSMAKSRFLTPGLPVDVSKMDRITPLTWGKQCTVSLRYILSPSSHLVLEIGVGAKHDHYHYLLVCTFFIHMPVVNKYT